MTEAPPESSPNVRQPEADRAGKEKTHAWVPPVVALLLLLLLLATLLWSVGQPGMGGGDSAGSSAGNGDAVVAGPGSGASDTRGAADTGASDGAGEGDLAVKSDLEAEGGADHAGRAASTDMAELEATDTGAQTAVDDSASAPSRVGSAPESDVVAPPRLGFQTDLLAPPQTTPPPPAVKTTPGDEGAVNPGLASFFGQTGRGSRFVYVIDRSGSMGNGRFDAARFELIKSIRSLREHESFYVIFYDSKATPMPAKALVPANESNQQQHIAWVRSISVGGGTDPSEAMTLALTKLRPDTIWLLSDGQFNVAVADTIRSFNPGGRVQINTIAFHDRGGEPILKIIANENDGDYRFVAP